MAGFRGGVGYSLADWQRLRPNDSYEVTSALDATNRFKYPLTRSDDAVQLDRQPDYGL